MRTRIVATGLLLALAACSPGGGSVGWDALNDGAWDGWGDMSADYGEGWADVTGPTVTVTGTVWSPGHMVPISGALVYFGLSDPAPIPSGAYPETCQDPPSPFSVLSAPDGTFTLEVIPGTYSLVVQKGQFRRVREYTVPAAGGPIDETYTTLPNATTADGDTIPSMALVFATSGGDHIEDVMAKLTLGSASSGGTLITGTEPFDIYNISPYPSVTELLGDLSLMLGYHIIFFPCTVGGYETLADPTDSLGDAAILANLRAFLDAGGKIYATDMMYDMFEQPLPIYLDICGDDAVVNAGDEEAWAHTETAYGWTSNGWSSDGDLTAWLGAVGMTPSDLDLAGNFVWIEGMYSAPPDPEPGTPVTPKVWVYGDFVLDASRTLPLTVTWPVGAGKVLFSTYHTVGDMTGPTLIPQEYILVYLIMEIGVCQSPLI